MRSILFICTANICRSPMAVGLFLHKLGKNAREWKVESAGTWASDGFKAARSTVKIISDLGTDISAHRSRLISEKILSEFNVVLTMERNQKESLIIEFQKHAQKIFLLSEMIDEIFDIRDPVGGSMDDFLDTAREIDFIINNGFEKIEKLAENG